VIPALSELHDRARELLEPAYYDYFAGGAGDEVALGENERAFQRLALLPRVLRGSANRNLAVELPGARATMPIIVSPTAFHGGVRRGSDAAIALALGATAVGIGRPVLWGLAAHGEPGVRKVLDLLRDELDHVLTLCGGRDLADLTRDLVVPRRQGSQTW
jgi:isopentenyl diphosphate isomerase/L-lactate dehydrogenase-like FMN-dependent dehydrogenase